ncbi:MAG: hypothetical protein KDA72_18560, partial [Planctomycetales bacterium]|nr:hypothetical protein [Planctomycetales bacterium]
MSLAVAVTTIAMSGAIAMSADVYELARMGGEMNAADRDSLEAKVEANPDDSESRTKLLGYYFINGRRDENAKLAKSRHIVWLIENAPESEVLGLPYGQLNKVLEPEGYEKAKQAWLTVIHDSPKNLTASLNASNFFLLHNREIAEELLLHGQEADPTNSVWAASLGQLYSLGLSRLPEGPEKVSVAKKAFQQYKLAYKLSEPLVKQTLLSSLAKTAFEAGSMDEAGEYARE